MKNIAICASGNGSNAERISRYFQSFKDVKVRLILSNNKNAYVLERAQNLGISTFVFSREDFYHSDKVLKALLENNTDLVVLAGFLWLVPQNLLRSFPDRIINIHPALLPKYGGKGMYGDKVHKAVIDAGEKYSGITIHHVNEVYDAGKIIFQKKVKVELGETPESLAQKIHKLEYRHYPEIIEKLVKGNNG